MIEKERLKELIEQGATIWTINKSGNINPVKTNKTCEIQRQYLMKEGQIYSYIEQTFETEEEVEWHKEFGCIERTERLELPTWEEFSKLKCNHIRFISKKGSNCKIEGYCDDGGGFIDIVSNGHSMLMVSDYSKETYINACRKAKELFLGENK